MTVKRTREIFGEEISHLTDEEVSKMNLETATLCDDLLIFLISNPIQKDTIDTQERN